MSNMIPLFTIMGAKKSRRKKLTEALLPTMIPGVSSNQMAMMSAVSADQQIRGAEKNEERAAEQTINGLLSAGKTDGKISDEFLNNNKVFKDILIRNPNLRISIKNFVNQQYIYLEETAEPIFKDLVLGAIELAEIMMNKGQSIKLTKNEWDGLKQKHPVFVSLLLIDENNFLENFLENAVDEGSEIALDPNRLNLNVSSLKLIENFQINNYR